MSDVFIQHIILQNVSAQLRKQFMSLTFSTIRYAEVFLWEMLLPYSVSPSSLFRSHLLVNLFDVLKIYQMRVGFFFFLKKENQVLV